MLSPRGRDYLRAAAISIVIVGVTGPAIVAALSLSLAIMAAISLILMRRGIGTVSLSVDPHHVNVFKGHSISTVVSIRSPRASLARVSRVEFIGPFGMVGILGKLDRGRAELSLTPSYAGEFSGSRIVVTLSDVLGLYSHMRVFDLDLTVDSLPISLLLPESPMQVSTAVHGDVSTGGRGSGQELYAVESYSPGSDAKDVMWKRLARSEDEKMHVRVREATSKAVVVLLYVTKRGPDPRTAVVRMDMASEAVAQVGRRLVSLGVSVEVAHQSDAGLSVGRASSEHELVGAIAEGLWRNGAGSDAGSSGSFLAPSDLLMVGQEMLEDERVARWLEERMPVLLLSGEASHTWSGTPIFTFSGGEDLSQLTEVLLEH